MDPLALRILVAIAFTALVAQFLLSGIQKLVNTRDCDDAKLMERFLGSNCALNIATLLFAGLWEVTASLIVLLTTYFDTHLALRRIALISLVVFTVLVTLMFKVKPFKYFAFISNVSVAGGLAIAATL